MIAALVALWLANPLLDLGGDSTCPTPAEVRDRLAQLSGSTTGHPASDRHRAYLSSADGMVHVELLGPDGRLLAERTLNRTGSCADVAEAVAVVLSTWEAEFNPNVATSVRLPPVTPCPTPAPTEVEETKPAPAAHLRHPNGAGTRLEVAEQRSG